VPKSLPIADGEGLFVELIRKPHPIRSCVTLYKLVLLFSILLLGPTKFVNKNVVHPVRLTLEFVP